MESQGGRKNGRELELGLYGACGFQVSVAVPGDTLWPCPCSHICFCQGSRGQWDSARGLLLGWGVLSKAPLWTHLGGGRQISAVAVDQTTCAGPSMCLGFCAPWWLSPESKHRRGENPAEARSPSVAQPPKEHSLACTPFLMQA